MAKQAKMKKGSIGKKALAAILAASMVLSSSAFSVLAATVDVIGGNNEYEISPVAEYQNIFIAVGGEEPVQVNAKGETTKSTYTVDYTGSAQTPGVVISEGSGSAEINSTFIQGTDYNVTYEDNTDAGTATVNVSVVPQSRLDAATNKVPSKIEFTIDKLDLKGSNTVVSWNKDEGFTYNGENQNPTIQSVKVAGVNNGQTITLPEKDYEVAVTQADTPGAAASTWKDAKNYVAFMILSEEGKKNLTLNASDEVKSKAENYVKYEISPAPFSVTVENNSFVYTGNAATVKDQLEKQLVVKNAVSGERLTYDKDYTLSYEKVGTNPAGVAPGTYNLTIVPKADGNYQTGRTYTTTYTITAGSLQEAINAFLQVEEANNRKVSSVDVENGKLSYEYSGSPQAPSADVIKAVMNGVNTGGYYNLGLAANIDNVYSAEIIQKTDVGSYEIAITGKGILNGKNAVIPFSIEPKPIVASSFVKKGFVGKTSGGAVSTNAILELKDGQTTLEAGKDYTCAVVGSVQTGTSTEPDGTLYNADGTETSKTGKKYVKVDITGTGNYTTESAGTSEKTVSVYVRVYNVININDSSITANVTGTWPWTGRKITPGEDFVVVKDGGKTLTSKGDKPDYKVSYPAAANANVDAGKGVVTITGTVETASLDTATEGYYGTRDIEFDITGTDVSTLFEIKAIDDLVWDAQEDASTFLIKPSTSSFNLPLVYKTTQNNAVVGNILDWSTGTENTADLKYSVNGKEIGNLTAATSYFKNSAAMPKGAYVVTVEIPAKGEYTGSLTLTYNIVPKELTSVVVSPIADVTYTGAALEPAVSVYENADNQQTGKAMVQGTDYTVEYTNNVNAGEGVVTITFIGAYSGSTVKTFKINKANGTVSLTEAQTNALANGMGVGDADCIPKLVGHIGDVEVNDTTLKVDSMESSNTSVAEITNEGGIKYVGKGTATVTITPSSDNLNVAPFDVTVKVTSTAPTKEAPKAHLTAKHYSTAKKTIGFTTNSVKGATKWEAQYSLKNLATTTKGAKKAYYGKSNRLKHKTIKVNKSKKRYYIRVRAYVDNKWTAWSEVEKITSR